MVYDAIYMLSLLTCISIGNYYRKIEDVEMKRNYGAGLGILMACIICGPQIYLAIIMAWGNIVIIKCCERRYVHQLSMAFTWTYLFYVHYHYGASKYLIWLHQTLALRLVGMAFEINNHDKVTNQRQSLSNVYGDQLMGADPTAVDIITYTFYFIGLHKGPYYRWKTFQAHFKEPFATLGDCRVVTAKKLRKVALFMIGYLVLSLRYSDKVYNEDSFYKEHNTDYRFLYNIPIMVMFFLERQAVMGLCTAVCTEAGFGVYPAKCQPIPGHGPTEHASFMNVSHEVALTEKYNFGMLKCFNNAKIIFGPRMKDTLRNWDMPTVYWFWTYPYKNLLKSNRETRSACLYLAWALWYAPNLQHLILSTTLWVYVNLEEEYSGIFRKRDETKLPWEIGFSIMRILCLIYLTPCVVFNDTSVALKYYNSIYWIYHWFLLISVFFAIFLQKILA